MVNVFFKTYGCQANVADSEGLMRYLSGLGCSIVAQEEEADLLIVNSCAVREKAEQKMFSYLGTLVDYKIKKPYMRMGIIGCVASYKKQDLYERFPHVHFVFGARDDMKTFQAYLFDLIISLETLKQLYATSPSSFFDAPQDRDVKGIVAKKNLKIPTPSPDAKINESLERNEVKKSFINIMTGCNNYCSFCIVPFTRGREKSYAISEIAREVEREVQKGSKEITLIGQNVNSYKDPDTGASFSQLLESVAQIPGEFWVRYISPHPKDMTRDVLEVMAQYHHKLCGWVHMPLQSGSDPILEKMNRPYTVERYMETIEWIRELLPHATITTDIIVGFPGETEEDYQGTRDVMERVKFDMSYSFIYSKRKYTKAFSMPDDVSHEIKQARLSSLQERQKQLCLENNLRYVGKNIKVLVEKRFSHDKLLARTEGNVRVQFNGPDSLIGTFAIVTIKEAGPVTLEGTVV